MGLFAIVRTEIEVVSREEFIIAHVAGDGAHGLQNHKIAATQLWNAVTFLGLGVLRVSDLER
jgi:hypothetical protein